MKRFLFLAIALCCACACAQVSVTPIVSPHYQFSDKTTGAPLAGGKVYTYLAGTTTPQATYKDSGGITTNLNPVILAADGTADIWLGPVSYKFIVQDSTGVTQWSADNVTSQGLLGSQATTLICSSPNPASSGTVRMSNNLCPIAYRNAANTGNETINLDAADNFVLSAPTKTGKCLVSDSSTTNFELAKVSSSNIVAATNSDAATWMYLVGSGGGTNCVFRFVAGRTKCQFSGSVTQGHFFGLDPASAPLCKDLGTAVAANLANVFVGGTVVSSQSGAGLWDVEWDPFYGPPATVGTSGSGGVWFPTVSIPLVGVGANVFGNAVNNQVRVVEMEWPGAKSITQVSMYVVTGKPGATCDYAIFAADGVTTLFRTTAGLDCSQSNKYIGATGSLGTVNLGTVKIGFCSSDATVVAFGVSPSSQAGAMMNHGASASGATIKYGTAANSCTAGLMPATLGNITPVPGGMDTVVGYFQP